MTTLVIRNGHLVDPGAGVDAPKDILLKDGRVAEIAGPGKLKVSNGAEILDADRPHRRPRPHRHSRPSARAGPGLQGDHRHRHRRSRSRRIHRRGRNAQHHARQ